MQHVSRPGILPLSPRAQTCDMIFPPPQTPRGSEGLLKLYFGIRMIIILTSCIFCDIIQTGKESEGIGWQM